MLLDRIGGLARGNDIVIHARVRNCTGEISAASDKGQTALQVVAKQQPGACVFLGRGAHATTPSPGRTLTASRLSSPQPKPMVCSSGTCKFSTRAPAGARACPGSCSGRPAPFRTGRRRSPRAAGQGGEWPTAPQALRARLHEQRLKMPVPGDVSNFDIGAGSRENYRWL